MVRVAAGGGVAGLSGGGDVSAKAAARHARSLGLDPATSALTLLSSLATGPAAAPTRAAAAAGNGIVLRADAVARGSFGGIGGLDGGTLSDDATAAAKAAHWTADLSAPLSMALVTVLMISSAHGFVAGVARGRTAAVAQFGGGGGSGRGLGGGCGGGGGGGGLLLQAVTSPACLAPLVSLLLGTYLLSSLLLLRVNVPCRYRARLGIALGGDLEFGFFHQW